ncbi:hypothetical protein SAMN04487995_5230 [Dyadobacter koreensis]|uniref:Uncharacterized protein n=1 Tax=Dyadobacter koreensis TaxID=408657 RepID=A0A1H6ZNS2_9BACT|nr:hypothetical protein [Dyadobacter koreensis]SEJ54908.1 hypothetical protein SAMN04487995_5230 [Dyadobacter koreensis]
MTKTFTYDDVVRYLYAETTQNENDSIAEALTLDDDLMNFYLDSLEIKEQMNKIVRTPSDRSVQKILHFSRQYSQKQSATALSC